MLTTGLAGLLGLCVGSFANVFLHRYPRGESLLSPPSRCPHCLKAVRWRHNIPVLSWLALGGRCHDCKARISMGYPLVEAAFGLLGLGVALRFGSSWQTWVYLLYFWTLLLAAIADWRTQYLYDVITLPLLVAGLGMSFVFPSLFGGIWQSPLAAVGMLGTMLALQFWGAWLFGREALGAGDVKLMAAAACFLGWPRCWVALLVASLCGVPLLLLFRAIRGGAWREPAPFGPALALGCAVAAWDLLSGAPVWPPWLGFGPV